MEFKYFNPNETYDNAICNGDLGALRALIVGIIGSDPTFATSEAAEAIRYIQVRSKELLGKKINLDENYIKQEDEYEKDISEWDEKYFQMQLIWLRYNFARRYRIPKIKEIGKQVYKNKATLGKEKEKNVTRENDVKKDGMSKNKTKGKKERVIVTTGDGNKLIRLSSNSQAGKNFIWIIMAILGIIIIIYVLFFF